MDYINQDLKNVLEPAMREATPQSKLNVDYEITRQDENILSVVFKGAPNGKAGRTKSVEAQITLCMLDPKFRHDPGIN
mgnify:CR=1 FL=1